MNILLTSSTFPGRELDGSRPRFVYDLAEALSAHATVFVLAPHHPGAAERERMGSVEVVRYRYWWPASRERLTPNMRQQLRTSLLARLQVPFFMVAQLRALARVLRRHRIDVVNAHWMIPQGLVAAALRGKRRPRFVHALHVHAGDVYLLARLPFGRRLARYIVTRTDRVFADGSHARDTLDALLGRPSGALLQPMGVHATLFGQPGQNDRSATEEHPEGFLLFIGRFVEKKGVSYLIRALPEVVARHPGLGLVLIGSGPDEEVLREEIRTLGVERHVRFVGHQPHDRIVGYLGACRAAVVPSVIDSHGETEGMPTVVVEAMAAGARVVATAVAGIPDVIRPGENGWLCRPNDPHDLAAKILSALADDRDSQVVEAAKESALRYDWTRVAASYMQALER